MPYAFNTNKCPNNCTEFELIKPDEELPYVVGYKGFRVGVRARNYHGENFHDASLKARNEAKFLNKEEY